LVEDHSSYQIIKKGAVTESRYNVCQSGFIKQNRVIVHLKCRKKPTPPVEDTGHAANNSIRRGKVMPVSLLNLEPSTDRKEDKFSLSNKDI
jgi:hypothetical protein